MGKSKDELVIMLRKGKKQYISKTPLKGADRVVFVYNGQFTNAPNTTQIANGAGKSGTAGNNGAINSPDTFQQQSVGAGGKAKNKLAWYNRRRISPRPRLKGMALCHNKGNKVAFYLL